MEHQFLFSCPVCGQPLSLDGNSFRCPSGHSFDRARSGYVNLLPPDGKHAKLPGDNRQMVNARREFLEKGFYRPMADALCHELVRELESKKDLTLLDAGCGEGYYTRLVYDALTSAGISTQLLGLDISKFAAEKAAKRFRTEEPVQIGAASIFHMPVADESCDVVITLFAPFCREEFLRVLKKGGLFAMVIPGARHLFGLKQAVYDQPYLNEVQEYPIEGLTFLRSVPVEDTITLHDGEIMDLFMMTPYYYKTSAEGQQRAADLTELTTETSFEILLYRKN